MSYWNSTSDGNHRVPSESKSSPSKKIDLMYYSSHLIGCRKENIPLGRLDWVSEHRRELIVSNGLGLEQNTALQTLAIAGMDW